MEKTKLTQFSHGSGCGCKVAPSVLDEILQGTQTQATDIYKRLLVGNDTKDDAAVYDVGNGKALVSTTDFFMPVVDDAFDFGKIAAANALSDVYAMGGTPFLALAILGWPVEKIPPAVAREVIKGAKEICTAAGVVLAGGHTIDAPEPFFGLSVNGWANTQYVKRNNTAHAGDILYLTKPIGTGILATALKRGLIREEEMKPAIEQMCTLNLAGSELGKHDFVHALTDVTGFGLLGHLIEMCEGSRLSAQVEYGLVPLMKGVKDLAAKFIYADNTMRNWKSYENKVEGISGESLLTLCDPQTSGGLLIAVDEAKEQGFLTIMQRLETTVYRIGTFTTAQQKQIIIS